MPVKASTKISLLFTGYGISAFLIIVGILAYFEEGMWDAMVWNDHKDLFGFFSFLPIITEKQVLSFLVPLLALPQITHYILDGFIWKIDRDSFNWKTTTLVN